MINNKIMLRTFFVWLTMTGIVVAMSAQETNAENPSERQQTHFEWTVQGNPIVTHKYTADAAVMVREDTLWLFTGEDAAGNQNRYIMHNWCVFSTTDMKHFKEHPIPLYGADFKWSSRQAYAGHVTERNGKFYFYVSTNATGIGVAIADRPEGPYKDALGKPLLTNADCFASTHSWACIDPAVFIDDDGQAWIFWGNRECYYAKLKENMIEIDGPVKQIMFDGFSFTEAPWIHKKDGKYYLTYASGFPEKIHYAISESIEGPWEFKGILNEIAGNSNTNHQAIVEYKGRWYFFYHNGAMQTQGTSYSRSVCVDYLYYNEDGSLKRVQMTSEGVDHIPGEKDAAFDTLAVNGAWCWFADPRAIYHKGEKEQTYFSWVTTSGDIVVASYNHQNGEFIQHVVLEKFQSDDHANPTLFIRDDGRIIVFVAAHFGNTIKRCITTNPEDISSWGEVYEFGHTVTYPYPFQLGKDSILVFFRGGSSWKPHMILSTDNGETFGTQKEFIVSTGKRPYMRYCQGADGSIHMAATTGHPRDVLDNKIFYCRFKDNRFYRADGSLIRDFGQEPLDVSEMDEVYDGTSCGKGWIWDIALEAETGFPVMVYASFPDDTDHRYHYARWNGKNWTSTELAKAGKWFPQTPKGKIEPEPNYSGGIILDYDDPSIVYLSKQVDGVFELFKYTTSDHGQSWESEALTENTPRGLLNVRPMVPRHHKKGVFDVVWMRGRYEFYADERYNTSLVFPKMEKTGEEEERDFNTSGSPAI
jgi:hypothetical protein